MIIHDFCSTIGTKVRPFDKFAPALHAPHFETPKKL